MRLPAKYKFITVADWGKIAAQHPEVFKGTDGVHFGGIRAGDILYAKVINQALTAAKKQTPAVQPNLAKSEQLLVVNLIEIISLRCNNWQADFFMFVVKLRSGGIR